jgi:hypothetical protein
LIFIKLHQSMDHWIHPSPGLDIIKSQDNSVKLCIEVFWSILDFALVRCDLNA